ncbi:probable serine/threonine-protein kinase At1g54610 [Euphorbia lathyris]|uniref:probable serine/threonine-protein kinase At1g54610 n=1 Tax=Euphorbia lathyris TaxID=212925 RepID=UPI00331346EB
MGCIASKESRVRSPTERLPKKGSSIDRRVAHVNSSRREDGIRSKSKLYSGDVKVMLIDKKSSGSNDLYDDDDDDDGKIVEKNEIEIEKKENCEVDNGEIEKKKKEKEKFDVVIGSYPPGWGIVSNSSQAEQVAAGWPSWLASVAGDAIKGWVPRRANTFEKLDRIGQGTYSNVYKARDITNDKLVAIKKVRFDSNDIESVKFMTREIQILRRLDHPNVIKLEGLITSQSSSSLYLVFEYMEHDLTGLISLPRNKFTEPQIKCYMQQLFSGLEHCHSRGVLHRDIKGSNLLVDENGVLKIADFGLASFFDPKSSVQMTSRVVTLWYRAPELLLGSSRYGVAVDLWSTGCILGEMYTGKPILPGRTEVEQLHKIFKLCGSPAEDYWKKLKLHHSSVIRPQRPYRRCVEDIFKDLPAYAVGLMETLLSMDPANRGSAASALKDKYFRSKPFACDPSSLPKYPPSKEIDAKMRDEEARRQGAAGMRENRPPVSAAGLASNAKPKLATLMQERRNSNVHSRNEINSQKEKTVSGFLIDPSKHTQPPKEGRRDFPERKKVSHSGPLVRGMDWTKSGKDRDDAQLLSNRNNLAAMSGLVSTRTSLPDDRQGKPSISQTEVFNQGSGYYGSSNGIQSATKQGQNHQLHKPVQSPLASSGKSNSKDASLYGHGGSRGSKIYVSGPLLASNNMEQMIKDHDRKITEFSRRRLDKTKKDYGQGKRENFPYISSNKSVV